MSCISVALHDSLPVLGVVTRADGTVQRFAGFAGRDDMSVGWIVKRARDPAICLAHSRERAQLRAKHGLDADLPLVGIFGVVGERKNAPMILAAMQHAGIDAKLVLAGKFAPEVPECLDGLAVGDRERNIVRHGFLPDAVLSGTVAAVDLVPPPPHTNRPRRILR